MMKYIEKIFDIISRYPGCYLCGKRDKDVIIKRGAIYDYEYGLRQLPTYYIHKKCLKEISCNPEEYCDELVVKCFNILQRMNDYYNRYEPEQKIYEEKLRKEMQKMRNDIKSYCTG